MPFLPAPPKFDAANVASKLPRPLQRPAGMALEGLRQVFGGDDPQGVMGVGMAHGDPPIADELGYYGNVIKTSLRDLGAHVDDAFKRGLSKRYPESVREAAKATFVQDKGREKAGQILGTIGGVQEDPILADSVNSARQYQVYPQMLVNALTQQPKDAASLMIQKLADAYHKGLGK